MASKFATDLFVDANTKKYSLTRVASFTGLLLLVATVTIAIMIMLRQQEIDHVLLVELMGFVLTTLGYKNKFGFTSGTTSVTGDSSDNSILGQQPPVQPDPVPPARQPLSTQQDDPLPAPPAQQDDPLPAPPAQQDDPLPAPPRQ